MSRVIIADDFRPTHSTRIDDYTFERALDIYEF